MASSTSFWFVRRRLYHSCWYVCYKACYFQSWMWNLNANSSNIMLVVYIRPLINVTGAELTTISNHLIYQSNKIIEIYYCLQILNTSTEETKIHCDQHWYEKYFFRSMAFPYNKARWAWKFLHKWQGMSSGGMRRMPAQNEYFVITIGIPMSILLYYTEIVFPLYWVMP